MLMKTLLCSTVFIFLMSLTNLPIRQKHKELRGTAESSTPHAGQSWWEKQWSSKSQFLAFSTGSISLTDHSLQIPFKNGEKERKRKCISKQAHSSIFQACPSNCPVTLAGLKDKKKKLLHKQIYYSICIQLMILGRAQEIDLSCQAASASFFICLSPAGEHREQDSKLESVQTLDSSMALPS